ncbi:GNAT family N-acetyltransferase [Blastococcus haudaquaticus]|uniref:Acetyltransferase involved in cellulose biosynthesis, CelD/BcsL family n=1 Tax=Blastococcus haudaquaticus TaxID=1938745 RepID=A0A286GY10_9ACTN|nr:GNAT family N-acetyltransferase [Blastococcus haudaquaticus]SOE00427.1 Acetyltransferase involved in cellulose biosynthesis, CelD/BcsL family [Blastococcus haudaquaticus]
MSAAALRVDVVTDDAAFEAMAVAWDELVASCATSTPFQAHPWLTSWWRSYGSPGRLRVVRVHDGDRMVAAAALVVERRGPVRLLRPVGAGISDFGDVLLADDVASRTAALEALVGALLALDGWDALDVPEARPGSVMSELAARWAGGRAVIPASTCLELPVLPLPELLSGLPGKTAKHIRRKLRRIDEVGVEAVVVAPAEAADAVDELLALHAAQWSGRGMNPEHGRDRFRRHLRGAVSAMAGDGRAVLVRYLHDGRTAGLRLNVADQRLAGAYLAGVDPALREAVDVATLMMRHNLELAEAAGVGTLSLLRGEEEYKFRWRPDAVRNERIVLGRPRSLPAVVHLAAVRGRGRAVPWVKARAPWVREIRDRALKTLRR